MRPRRVWPLLLCTHCSWCAAPKATPEDDPTDRDAAPHAQEVRSRCSVQSKMALPGVFELGRVTETPSRVMIGARRGTRAGVVDTDGLTVRFTEVTDAVGDVPPPLPLVSGERTIAIAYEGAKAQRRLVLRDAASPAAALAELPRDPPDESLAYDAVMLGDGGIAVAWDAPAEEGSAIFASIVHDGKVEPAARLSPRDVDADTPRLIALGPTLVAMWIAHRALPSQNDGAIPIEGAGQDLDRTWVELLAFARERDGGLHATSPLRHLTPDTGRVVTFDVRNEGGVPPMLTVVARDALELQAGQGGTALLVRVRGPEIDAPVVLAEHVGRGTPLHMNDAFVFDDPEGRGRMAARDLVSPEPALDAARPLAALASGDVLVAPEGGTELHVLRCR